ncbi:alpha/beta fold hydrolase [Motilimonas pumila]|uniref:Alpha/beta hydrolase n=1 Tax=Motilimonas pumila TaxID=2303987 RepID=A0A418YJQ1_9GAMM|nr:alpha/beta fold hydrolase [Motilimonas pumila]RJG51212.1 alpha/beta hydrolase [Motilimonas pumila]
MSNVIIDGPQDAEKVFIFAHGAGAGSDHEFMQTVAEQVAAAGIKVVRFDFPYMVRMKQEARRLPPNRMPQLLAAFTEVIEQYGQDQCFIGGKSMGGRMASHLTEHAAVQGVVMLGFPFHPVGKPERLKGEHLASLSKPALLIQGERDTMGTQTQVASYDLSATIEQRFLVDGDHSFKPRKASGFTQSEHIATAAQWLVDFIHAH